jgi:hypothetical protein
MNVESGMVKATDVIVETGGCIGRVICMVFRSHIFIQKYIEGGRIGCQRSRIF